MHSTHHPTRTTMTMEEHTHSNYFPPKCCALLHLLLLLTYSNFLLKPCTAVIYLPGCSPEKFAPNTPYQSNLIALLSSLSSNATVGSTEFYNATVGPANGPNTVYGLFMCRGDIIQHQLCRDCVSNATQKIASYCTLSKQAMVGSDFCFVRYSDRNIFSQVDEQHRFEVFNLNNVSDHLTNFTWTLANTLDQVAADAASCGPVGTKKFATREARASESRTLYTLAQCTPDLSMRDCSRCLHDAVDSIAGCCLGRAGGRVGYPSCNVRFELFQFYWFLPKSSLLPSTTTSTTPLSPHGSLPRLKGKRRIGSQMLAVIVVAAVVSVMLLGLGGCLLRKRARKSEKAVLREILLRNASTTSLEFNLATIEAATNKFSPQNKIGKGGFGEVYKGILSDGQEIAVKRLSTKSSQGFTEFKNEILLIAKLQHRNLVALLGFYLDEQENILIYEYVPNKSLDYFLFDSKKERQLSWFERHQIIGGIAGAILYLHEHSRLKVIHCDLKPSNILLDDNMNPKISDFGMAKIIAIDEIHGRTSIIAGTRGYMSPEYARLGIYSEKSDIFSFGVILLEIITGKRNTSNELQCEDGLLNYAWKQWNGQTPLRILDSNIKDSCCEAEVVKCIQIGLLCVQEDCNVRPSMSTIVSYISNFSVKLPSPQEPAFFIRGKKGPKAVAEESRSVVQAATNNSMPCSINNVTMSRLHPR